MEANERVRFYITIYWQCDYCGAYHNSNDGETVVRPGMVMDWINDRYRKITKIECNGETMFDVDILPDGRRLVQHFVVATYTAEQWKSRNKELVKLWNNCRAVEQLVIEKYNIKTGRQMPLPVGESV